MMRARKPALLIVCGPPAAGKSTIARGIGDALGLPIVAKDAIKEALMDHVGGGPGVGAAAFAVQFAIARELLRAGAGLVLEGAFFRNQAEIADVAAAATPVVIEVLCAIDVLERRYTERHEGRHPGHRGLEALPDLHKRVEAGAYGVPDLRAPTLEVDTTHEMRPPLEEVVEWIRARLA